MATCGECVRYQPSRFEHLLIRGYCPIRKQPRHASETACKEHFEPKEAEDGSEQR